MDIKILPSNIANLIAAGEVVQRPSSVVKELVENAVDAGADRIDVVVRDSGRTLIQVIDNGCGMSPDEAVLCFERHATSKIATAADLNDIRSFGFRGEALASIAAVAEVTLRTRRAKDEVGCEVVFANSQHCSTEQVACPQGTNFAVRNLFYNVPARRKFLKSDNVEFKHIVSEFTRVALTRPDVGFSLSHNGKDIFLLKPAISLKFRIQDLLGTGVVNEIVDVSAHTSVVNLSGFIGRPDLAKKGLGNQYFFVNGRYFRSPYLHKAVMKGYENLIPDGFTPSYFIYLDVDPKTVDVNISPTKTEIKFEDDSVIFQIIQACIKETLGRNSFGQGIDFDRDGAPDIPVFGKHFDEFHPLEEPRFSQDPTYNPFEDDGFPSEASPFLNTMPSPLSLSPSMSGPFPSAASSTDGASDIGSGSRFWPNDVAKRYADSKDDYSKLFEDNMMPSTSIIVFRDKYILTTVRSGVLLVNIRRAKERVMYERFLKAISRSEHVTQCSLFPVTVQVGVENMTLFEEHAELLSSVGFDISPFGSDTIVVNGVPEGYSVEPGKVQTMVSDLLIILSDDHASLPGTMASAMAERFARLGATDGSRRISASEAQSLIDSLFSCDNAEYTISGHKTMVMLSADDLDNKFNNH